MAQTLNWTLDLDHGTISFGRLLPLTGNTYNITVSGGETGKSYTFYVMDETGEVCLAKSADSSISFNTTDLRNQFAKDWHEIMTFHTVCSDGESTVAEGDLSVVWNPVWTDAETGAAYSMKGDPGAKIVRCDYVYTDEDGNYVYNLVLSDGGKVSWTAPRGPSGYVEGSMVKDSATGKYHALVVYTNEDGEKMVALDQVAVDDPSVDKIVTVETEQEITGEKTFSSSIHANGGLIGSVTGDVTGSLTGDVTGDVQGSIDATEDGDSALVPTVETGAGDNNAASTAWVKNVLGVIYPVGSIYIGTQAECPMSSLFTSTWEKIEGRYLLASGKLVGGGDDEEFSAGSEVSAGIVKPDIEASTTATNTKYSDSATYALSGTVSTITSNDVGTVTANVNSDGVYGSSATVRPSAFVVNVWRRTA